MSRYSFWDFKKARDYVRSLNISSVGEWTKYYKTDLRPSYIPTNPHRVYKNEGWISYTDWLGGNEDKRKYKVNDDYFKTWSHNMAYILGFWWTDGYLDEKHKIFTLTQHQKDRQLLQDILSEMQSDYPIRPYGNKKGKDYIRIDIRSKGIVDSIIKIGGKQKKSLTIKFPNVPKKYLPDFIKGLWDGDGYIGWVWNDSFHKYRKINSSIASGSLQMINSLKEVLNINVPNTKGKIKIDRRKKGTIQSNNTVRTKDHITYSLVFYQNDTRRLRDFIYQNDGICMFRKKKIFDEAGVKREFWDYNKAKEYVGGLSILTRREWDDYSKSGKRPIYIPAFPPDVYKNKGWVSWMNWLGTDIKTKG